jgi:hypothetical protein
VESFQEKYGIATPSSTGYGRVGPLTQAKVNQIISNSQYLISNGGSGSSSFSSQSSTSSALTPSASSMSRSDLIAYIKAQIIALQKQLVILLQELVKIKMQGRN